MQERLRQFLAQLDGPLIPIRNAAEQLLKFDDETTEENKAFLISRRPKIAPQAYACVLYQGLGEDLIDRYAQQRNVALPEPYRKVLWVLNGADVYGLSLYGIPPSMCADPPLLNRSARQPFDIGEANRSWYIKYKPAPNHLYFGGSPYSHGENLGYFLNVDGSVSALRVGGAAFKSWRTMREFLDDEIRRNEESFPEYEESAFQFQQELERAQAEKRKKERPQNPS